MSLSLFIARRIYRESDSGKQVSRPASFCLYWQENRCQLSYITLDAPGLCENCVYLEFPEKFLRMERRRQLDKLEEA